MVTDLERQIADRLKAISWRLGPLLGLDIVDTLDERINTRAPMLAAQLTGGDDNVTAETVIDLMAVLWPDSDPPSGWWQTPLGRAVAMSGGIDGSAAVTVTVASAMLGVTKGRVTQLADAGKLDRHPDGGITRLSVAQRLRA